MHETEVNLEMNLCFHKLVRLSAQTSKFLLKSFLARKQFSRTFLTNNIFTFLRKIFFSVCSIFVIQSIVEKNPIIILVHVYVYT